MPCGVWESTWLTLWDTFERNVLRGLEQLKDFQGGFKWKTSHIVSTVFIYLLKQVVLSKTCLFVCFLLHRCFTGLILTWSGSRGTSACTSSTCLTRIRRVELSTWPDILSTTCLNTSAAWTQTNVINWLTGGSGMFDNCDTFLSAFFHHFNRIMYIITKYYITSLYSPLPEEMIQYARTDTHYLLYIYDCVRAQLLDFSHGQPGRLQCVWNKSRDISLKVCKDRSLLCLLARQLNSSLNFGHLWYIEVPLVWICIQSAGFAFFWEKPRKSGVKVHCSNVLGLVCLFWIQKWSSCISFIVINCWVERLSTEKLECLLQIQ